MIIDFSDINVKDKPTLVLKNLDMKAIQPLGFAKNIHLNVSYNEISEISFDIPSHVEGIATPHYSEVVGMRIVDLVGIGQFLLINPSEKSDGNVLIKSCKGYSLEYEFAKKDFYMEAGVFKFFDIAHRENTIIGRLLEKMPDWSIEYIDSSLYDRYRTFTAETKKKAYEFIKTDVQESYGCIFSFDTYQRTIRVVSVDSKVAQRKVYLSQERLIKEVEIDEDSESIITCLDVNGAEGVSIRNVNPTGTNMIYNLDYFMNEKNFSDLLINKWRTWVAACEARQAEYMYLAARYQIALSENANYTAELNELNGEMTGLQNQKAVAIQAQAQGMEPIPSMETINALIAGKQSEIDAVNSKKTQSSERGAAIYNSMKQINENLSMENFFGADLQILKRYFIEDSLQDGSFALASTQTYKNDDLSSKVNGTTVLVSQANVSITTDSNYRMYSITGGQLDMSTLSAKIVRGTIQRDYRNDRSVICSFFLERGWVGEIDFSSATLTLVLDSSAIISNTQTSISLRNANGTLYFTRNTTSYEQYSVELELYQYGQQVLSQKASPTYHFSVSSGNFLASNDFQAFKDELTLGERIYLNLGDGRIITPFVTSVSINFDDPSDFSIEFSDTYTSFDSAFNLSSLLEQSVSMGKSLGTKGGMYSEFVSSGASSSVKSFMDSALDLAKNAVLSSGNQAVSIDDSGIRLRKWKDKDAGTYEDEQIWMNDNVIAFTTDNWNTAKMAIGKIFDENIKNYVKTTDLVRDYSKTYYIDQNGTVWDTSKGPWNRNLYELHQTAYGIVADYLVGNVIAGQNLFIGTTDGSFKVDSSGVYIDSLKLTIAHGAEKDTTLADALNSLSENTDLVATLLDEAISQFNDDIQNKTITTYYQGKNEGIPPAKSGDLWYVNGNEDITQGSNTYRVGHLYRFQGNVGWQEIEDANAIVAISNAEKAQATADRKIVSYYQDEEPEDADVGDLWHDTAAGKLYRFNGVNWDKVEDVDIGSLKDITSQMATSFANQILDINGKIAKTITSYYGNTIPSSPNDGDILYYTGADTTVGVVVFSKGHLYRYSNSNGWQEIQDANAIKAIGDAAKAQDVADGKTMVFYQNYITNGAPTINDHSKGDIWYNAATTNRDGYEAGKFYYCDGSSWIKIEDKTLSDLQNNINALEDRIAEFYSGGYLNTDKLSSVINAQRTAMQSASGNVLFDKDGLWLMDGTSKATTTMAIWMNEHGILFGSGAKSSDPGASSGWTWTTAINHHGITAKALTGKTISGLQVYGGELYIGQASGTDLSYANYIDNVIPENPKDGDILYYTGPTQDGFIHGRFYKYVASANRWGLLGDVASWNFTVDKFGTVTANNGTFSGTIRANDLLLRSTDGTGTYESVLNSLGKIKGKYLDLEGITITSGSQTAMTIDSNGITLYGGAITWGSSIPVGNVSGLSGVATSGNYYDLSNRPTILTKGNVNTYIDEFLVASPTIKGGVVLGGRFYDDDGLAYFEIGDNGYGDFTVYSRSGGMSFQVYDEIGSIAYKSYNKTWLLYNDYYSRAVPQGTWNFSSATVTGLHLRFTA